jgi:uncharacterized protein YjbI with pentapeptide repeats
VTVEPEPSRTAEPQEQSSRRPRLGFITALAIFTGVVIVIIYGYLARPGWIGVSGKQFWDYLDLLIVPAALALGVYWLNRRQNERDQQAEKTQQERALAVERQRAQDEALQAYLNQMSQLLADTERPLRRARPGDMLSMLARAQTLTTLTRLDGVRKRSVVQFLDETDLINKHAPVILLDGADLKGANLSDTNLLEVRLSLANLREAELSDAFLTESDLRGAQLQGAHLQEADLGGADLSLLRRPQGTASVYQEVYHYTDLSNADLINVFLRKADLGDAILSKANLTGAKLINAQLYRADLRDANLSGADLSGADLRWANLSGADLSGANLSNANLSDTFLSDARGVTNEELEQQAASLEFATMPNGQKYEDWLKSREEENSDSQ